MCSQLSLPQTIHYYCLVAQKLNQVAAAVADVAATAPLNGIVEIAGPERIRLNDLVQQFLAAHRDSHMVVIDRGAGYYGTTVNDQSLMPGDHPRLGRTRFEEWLRQSRPN